MYTRTEYACLIVVVFDTCDSFVLRATLTTFVPDFMFEKFHSHFRKPKFECFGDASQLSLYFYVKNHSRLCLLFEFANQIIRIEIIHAINAFEVSFHAINNHRQFSCGLGHILLIQHIYRQRHAIH